ncbi:MAG: hypothetical protein FWE19_05135 [Oscillospiraceae bacterium]|nr:hypothetical protein [Oscillospiraceae bacterium]
MDMNAKLAYLKGLAEGLGVDKDTKEGKLFSATLDLLDDVVLAITEMSEGLEHMGEDIEAIEEDLDEVLEDLYGDEDEDEGCHHGDYDFEGELYEVTCPACGDQVCVDEDMLDEGEIACPGCGKTLEFDLSGELDKEELGDNKA